jgi:hypothetical protein
MGPEFDGEETDSYPCTKKTWLIPGVIPWRVLDGSLIHRKPNHQRWSRVAVNSCDSPALQQGGAKLWRFELRQRFQQGNGGVKCVQERIL